MGILAHLGAHVRSRNANATNQTNQPTMVSMKNLALLCLVAFAGFASVCTAQEDAALVVEPAMDAIDAGAANGTANATSTAEAEAASGSPTFPVFNYEAIYPNGIFDAAAYESYMAEVTQFYTDIYATYAGEGAKALENF